MPSKKLKLDTPTNSPNSQANPTVANNERISVSIKDAFNNQFNPSELSTNPIFNTATQLHTTLERVFLKLPDNQTSPNDCKTDSLAEIGVKNRLIEPFTTLNGDITPLQTGLYTHIGAYRDTFYFNDPVVQSSDGKTLKDNEIRRILCLHALNHVYKTRDMVLKNSEKLSEREAKEIENELKLGKKDVKNARKGKEMEAKGKKDGKTYVKRGAVEVAVPVKREASTENDDCRDQGFTRAKVLIVVPFRSIAYKIVNDLMDISGSAQTVRPINTRTTKSALLMNADQRKTNALIHVNLTITTVSLKETLTTVSKLGSSSRGNNSSCTATSQAAILSSHRRSGSR
jgi:Utp25, U3 small nucleolar RNA-associated SSU processome protein 25